MTRDTHTYFRAFSSGVVTTCFYDLGQSRLGFEQPTAGSVGSTREPLTDATAVYDERLGVLSTQVLHSLGAPAHRVDN